MHYDALIFDLDGTLWNTNTSCTQAWNKAFSHLGIAKQITLQGMNSVTGKPMHACIDILCPGIRKQMPDIQNILVEYERKEIAVNGAYIYDHVNSCMNNLSKSYKLFIVSNCEQWYLNKFLEFSDLSTIITDIDCFGASNISKHKMISLLKTKHFISSALYIGDTASDLEAATLSNCDFIQATYGFGEPIDNVLNFNNFVELSQYLLSPF